MIAMPLMTRTTAVLFFAVPLAALPGAADEADTLFDDSVVHEIRISFDDPSWYETLLDSHSNDPDDPYFPARFEYGDMVLDPVGVRFKGNSSFRIPGVKKPFRIDFNEYDEGIPDRNTTFLGLKKLNLNNGFKDPTLLREKLFLDFCAQYLPTLRAVHARVFVNGVYWGLYTAVEHLDSTFIENRFGGDEDGNLFEGESSGAPGSFGSDLSYRGPDPEDYYDQYQLKTNLGANDWSDLVEFIDVLNNTPTGDLPARLEPIFDVDSWLTTLATDILFVNLDSYPGSAHNYYLYDRDDSGRLTYLHWDVNEAFGAFRYGVPPGQDVRRLDIFWLPEGDPGGVTQTRPLMSEVWAVDSYRRDYLRWLARMLREGFDHDTFSGRIHEFADLIRADVYADPHKPYSNDDFEAALTTDVATGQGTIHGLLSFVHQRADFVKPLLDDHAEPADLRLNELVTVNLSGITDDAGDQDPWVEIYNLGPGRLSLDEIWLTDDPGQPLRWSLPATEIEDGGFVIVWLDGEPAEGANHAPFNLESGGGDLCLISDGDPAIAVDCVTYPALAIDHALARLPDGDGGWSTTDRPTPGLANSPSAASPALFINELMAENDSTITDPAGNGGYPDWLEIYNAEDFTFDLGGMYLSDDPDDPSKWQVPAGVCIPAHGHLIIWADNDTEQGPTHAPFKLDADGEELALYDADVAGRRLIDRVAYPEQTADISYGRESDGAETFVFLQRPTPGSPNATAPRRPSGRVGPG